MKKKNQPIRPILAFSLQQLSLSSEAHSCLARTIHSLIKHISFSSLLTAALFWPGLAAQPAGTQSLKPSLPPLLLFLSLPCRCIQFVA